MRDILALLVLSMKMIISVLFEAFSTKTVLLAKDVSGRWRHLSEWTAGYSVGKKL